MKKGTRGGEDGGRESWGRGEKLGEFWEHR